MNKKIKLVFLASLLLNAVLIGIFLGQSPRRFDWDARREQRIEQAIEGLPAEAQSRLRGKSAELWSAARQQFERIRSVQDEAVRILSTNPFDEAAYDHQIREINRLRIESTNRLAKLAKETALSLPPEERRRFAKTLRRPRPSNRNN